MFLGDDAIDGGAVDLVQFVGQVLIVRVPDQLVHPRVLVNADDGPLFGFAVDLQAQCVTRRQVGTVGPECLVDDDGVLIPR